MSDLGAVERLSRELGITLPRRARGSIDAWSQSPGFTVDQSGNVIDLNLYELGIRTFPLAVLELKNLRLLDLGHNELTTIPEGIGSLVHLETLDLGSNHLTSIPAAIGILRSLRQLILWGNQLVALPRQMANLNQLEVFNAFNNPIKYPPPDILSGDLDRMREFLRITAPETPVFNRPLKPGQKSADDQAPLLGRGVPSERTMPLVGFDGFLKQITRESLGQAAEMALDKAFPQFWPADPSSAHFKQQYDNFQKLGVDYVFADLNTPRRLSGCWGLPKARYYSLCFDTTGDDSNTLVNELNAYLDPMRGGLCLFGDMGVPQTKTLLQNQFDISAPEGPYLLVLFVGRPGAPSPVIAALAQHRLLESVGDQYKERVVIGVEIPYKVEHHVINDVCDLRLPECQDYVVEEFFKKDTSSLRKISRRGIDKFVQTLPVLMHPALGGGAQSDGTGALLQALAAFLRLNGAQAVIFPSARSDVLAEIRNLNLERWRGWCLVDYRETPPPVMSGCADLSEGWPATFPKGATIRVADSGEFLGSFEVNGVVAWGRERVGELESQFIMEQSSL